MTTGQHDAPTRTAGARRNSVGAGTSHSVPTTVGRDRAAVAPALAAHDAVALWASARVAELATGPDAVPEYGSLAWRGLRGDDPRRAAALVLAAEQWRRDRMRAAWLEQLRATDPDRWARTVASGTDEGTARAVAYRERPDRRPIRHQEPRPLRPSPGWPPVAIPGGRGRHLTHREGPA